MDTTIAWLLEGPPWVQYRTRLDLLGQVNDDDQVIAARKSMIAHSQIQRLLNELAEWPGPVLTRHNDAKLLLHKLVFLADLGLQASDHGVQKIIEKIMEHRAQEGPFQVVVNIPVHFGGTSQDQWAWMLCDAPSILYALIKFGLANDSRVQTAVQYLAELVRDNGWPCAATPELGKFKGPGRREDPCPYANLLMLKLLAQLPQWNDSNASHKGAETLLSLWQQRQQRRPFIFAMGTDFAKLKLPFIWYDILHVLEVLTQFPWLRSEPRLQEMINIVRAKADNLGRFIPESVWKAWQDWDMGQKRQPSRWLTLVTWRLLNRIDV